MGGPHRTWRVSGLRADRSTEGAARPSPHMFSRPANLTQSSFVGHQCHSATPNLASNVRELQRNHQPGLSFAVAEGSRTTRHTGRTHKMGRGHRGGGGSGRGGRGGRRPTAGSGNRAAQPAAAPPSGEALVVELRATPEFSEALSGQGEHPAAVGQAAPPPLAPPATRCCLFRPAPRSSACCRLCGCCCCCCCCQMEGRCPITCHVCPPAPAECPAASLEGGSGPTPLGTAELQLVGGLGGRGLGWASVGARLWCGLASWHHAWQNWPSTGLASCQVLTQFAFYWRCAPPAAGGLEGPWSPARLVQVGAAAAAPAAATGPALQTAWHTALTALAAPQLCTGRRSIQPSLQPLYQLHWPLH
jgi:hypothetical protein